MIPLPTNIEKQFALEGTVKEIRLLGEGLINETYIIETEGNESELYSSM